MDLWRNQYLPGYILVGVVLLWLVLRLQEAVIDLLLGFALAYLLGTPARLLTWLHSLLAATGLAAGVEERV
ncbi:MAG: hypothetical protein HY335_01225 [Deinococcus sp.]|nr:hypothetical protein [Deinococcus sp.]